MLREIALLLLAALAWIAPAHALSPGDLLVSDLANARILHVRANGSVAVLSPKPGSGPNLLEAPTGIVVAPDQRIFVVDNDTDALIEIDPVTGAQREIQLFRIIDDEYVPSSTGQEPWGLALDDFGGLWVSASASNIVRRIGIATGVVETVLTANDLGTGPGPYGLWVDQDALATEVIVANGTAGTRLFSSFDDATSTRFQVNATVLDVELQKGDTVDLLYTLYRTPGSGSFSCGAESGLYGNFVKLRDPIEIVAMDSAFVTGGLIRCPYAMVRADAFYVAEAESTIGGNARIVRIATDGGFVTSLFANLPDGASDTIPAGIAYVAAPEVSSGVAGLIAIACLWTLRRQAASRLIQARS